MFTKNIQYFTPAFLFVILFVLQVGCTSKSNLETEEWMKRPVSEWPDFALTNDIGFTDITYRALAYAFFVDTGKDTIEITCKHIFMIFQNRRDYRNVNLKNDFLFWEMYPNRKPDIAVNVNLINQDKNEPIGQFNTLKVRDWLIFEIANKNKAIFPLKIRYSPIEKNEIIYAVGRGQAHKDYATPVVTKLQCIQSTGVYYFVKALDKNTHPEGTSGSAVIDKNGYFDGIVSGSEANLGVVGSIQFLKNLFDKYGIDYTLT